MKKKLIVGAFFAVFLVAMMPIVSSIQEEAVDEALVEDEECSICPLSNPETKENLKNELEKLGINIQQTTNDNHIEPQLGILLKGIPCLILWLMGLSIILFGTVPCNFNEDSYLCNFFIQMGNLVISAGEVLTCSWAA